MESRGILRKSSPIKKRNLSTQLLSVKRTSEATNARLIDHNRASFDENFHSNIDNGCKYKVSKINTTSKVEKKLEQLKNFNAKIATIPTELSPRSKVFATEKALKKLNIESDTKIYKHLPPINVNESALAIQQKVRKDKKINALSTADVVPKLDKYLRPLEKLEFRIELSDFDDSDDESLTRTSLANENFLRLYDTYRQYLDPLKPPFKDSI